MARRRRELAILAAILLTTGCAVEDGPGAGGTSDGRTSHLGAPSATLLEGASFSPPPDPPSSGPAAELVAEIDLTDVGQGEYVYPQMAVSSDDGAYVAVTDRAGDGKTWLAVVGPADDGLGVVATHEIPPFNPLEGISFMRVLDDGTVLVAGHFAYPEDVGQGADYGYVVVDPDSGEFRQVVVLPAEGNTSARAYSTLSSDGGTLYAAVLTEGPGLDSRLVAFDVATETVVAERDVRADPATNGYPWLSFAGLAPRADGGVRVLYRAGAEAEVEVTVPLLADYGPDLAPAAPPVQLQPEPSDLRTALIPGATDGTAFAIVDVGAGGEVIVVPPGADAGIPLIRSVDVDWLVPQAVEAGQTWLTVPLAWGAGSIDLTTGRSADAVDTGCRDGQGVRWAFPGADGVTFLLGACGSAELLWIVGP